MHIELARSPRHRRRLRLAAAVLGSVALGASVLGVAGIGGGRSLVGRVSLLVVAFVLVALAVRLVRAAAAPPGHLELTDDQLVLHHPELLRAPIVLARSQLRTVLVDPVPARPTAGMAPEHAPRFALVETGGDPAWLHPGARAALPHLGDGRTVPDAVVVLRSPYRLGRSPRRLLAFLVGNEELRALATCGGFFLDVADARSAAAAVHDAGLDAPLTLAEANRLEELAADRGILGHDR